MKNMKKFLTAFLAVAFILFALQRVEALPVLLLEENTPTAGEIVQWLTPFIVLGVTWGVRKLIPIIPGWATMLVVTLLSTAVTWANGLLDSSGDLSFLMQVLYGMLAVTINQIYRQFTGGNTEAKKKNKKGLQISK